MPRFLSAAWRHLVMLNYTVDPAVLAPLVPRGTELDSHHGVHYVSVVGFRFLNTRLLGVPVPFHRNFDEVNLRFYVRRFEDGEIRRGVVFIKELVAKFAVAAIARWVYNEKYVRCRMAPCVPTSTRLEYRWHNGNGWHAVGAEIAGEPMPVASGSEEEFITAHYWGYTRQRNGGTMEYRVEHEPWRVCPAKRAWLNLDTSFYGPEFADALGREPTSAFIADGSPVVVYRGRRIT